MPPKFLLVVLLVLVLAIVASTDAAATFVTTSAVLVFATVSEAMPISTTVMPNPTIANSSYLSGTSTPSSVVATVQKIDQQTAIPLTSNIAGLIVTETATATEIDRLSPIQEGDNPPRNGLAHSTVVAIVVSLFLFIGLVGSIFIWMNYYRPTKFARMLNDDSTTTAAPMIAAHFGAAPSSHDARLVGRG
ncbi:hypothetical protein DXG01_008704 [Tephrocybe rancida]|nr:hypothetical protein DXG01_008704 [Tephrocybe rancida]